MLDHIKHKLALLEPQPGCYLMKNNEGQIIYIGKAKRLNNRVASYFNRPHEGKTQKLVSEIVDFETIVTTSEKEAFILEINLIQQHNPRYNIMLKDNRSYPYIQISNDRHPYLKIARHAKQKNGKYFGPFPNATAAFEIITLLNRLFPLRKCLTLPTKPCLYYHMKQCLAPCIQPVDTPTYEGIINQISQFMRGDVGEIKERVTKNMLFLADQLEFEQANEQKKLLESIDHVISQQKIQFADRIDRDVFGFFVRSGYISIAAMMYRNGVLSAKDCSVFPLYEDAEDAFSQYLMQFYQRHTRPKEILISDIVDVDLLATALDTSIITPERGAKSDLIQMVAQNARIGLDEHFAITTTQHTDKLELLENLGNTLGINSPMLIDMIDNSHLSGDAAVSAVIVFRNGEPVKNLYRKYRHDNVSDDLTMMRNTIYRRYYRKLTEQDEFPQLLIVDGGALQVAAAKQVLTDLNLLVNVCGLAKDDKHRTRALISETGVEINIQQNQPLFFFLTKMQDEVHRYVISFHRQVRSKSLTSSILDQIPGLGPKRKQKLLEVFGSVRKIQEASVSELRQYVPLEIAQLIQQYLNTMDQSPKDS